MRQDLIQRAKNKNLINLVIKQGYTYKNISSCIMIICPFHDEKHASMAIYEDGYKCFGCDESGDIISWVMNLYDVSFVDAVKYLLKNG